MTQAATQPEQLPLFAEIGVAELPAGMADLTAKETRFVLAYLRTGLAATAAREAGYSDPEADAAKIRKRPKIAAILTQAASAAAGNAKALAAGAWQQAQAYFAEWEQIYPELRQLRASGLPMPANDEDKCQARYLQRLRFLEERERTINTEIGKLRTLLAGVKITVDGDMALRHQIAPEERELIEHLNAELARRPTT